MKGIFFNSSNEDFCSSNILLSINNINDDKLCNTIGLRWVFLHTRNNTFNDRALQEIANNMDYLDYKDDIEAIKTDKKYNYINEVAVKFLKNVDTTGYIKTFNRELKRKKKNESFSVKNFTEYKFYAGFDTEFISNIQYNARLKLRKN